jgi:hypothetical protein
MLRGAAVSVLFRAAGGCGACVLWCCAVCACFLCLGMPWQLPLFLVLAPALGVWVSAASVLPWLPCTRVALCATWCLRPQPRWPSNHSIIPSSPPAAFRLDVLRKVVPHRDRANTAAFLEEVISYVLGLKKRLAEVEGVAEADLQVPLVDVQPALCGEAVPSADAHTTVVGNPSSSAVVPSRLEERGVAMGSAPPMAMSTQGALTSQMLPAQFQDGMISGVDTAAMGGAQKGLMAARGMPAPSMNSNQVCPACA